MDRLPHIVQLPLCCSLARPDPSSTPTLPILRHRLALPVGHSETAAGLLDLPARLVDPLGGCGQRDRTLGLIRAKPIAVALIGLEVIRGDVARTETAPILEGAPLLASRLERPFQGFGLDIGLSE